MKPGALIVGASHAGVQAAFSLRQAGWQEPITLISGEAGIPYHRPPLSKAFLLGEKSDDQILLRSEALYAAQGIDLLRGETAESIDPGAKRVATSAGVFDYRVLVLATGARARPLPVAGAELAGVHSLRDLADARRLREALADAASVAIVGGGYIGLEVASTAAKNGKAVTVVEMQPRLLTRSMPEMLAGHLQRFHAAKGVRFVFGRSVASLEGTGGRVEGVRLDDGTRLDADLVLVGIGGVANLELAEAAGLTTEAGGVLVDAHGRTSAPCVYAAGDCAAFDNPFAGRVMRLESVQNAVDQAKAAAGHAAGQPAPLSAVPWFWTDQYELKVQMAGIAPAGAEQILRGDPESDAFSLLHLQGGRLVASFSVNRAADHMASRKLIGSGVMLDPAAAAAADVPLARTATGPELRAAAQ